MADDWLPQAPKYYAITQRAFVQALMARGSMTFAEGRHVLADILSAYRRQPQEQEQEDQGPVDPASISLDQFKDYMAAAREAVSFLDYDIRNMRPQQQRGATDAAAARQADGGGGGNSSNSAEDARVWALVNVHSDPATQMATTRTPDEMAFVKRLLDAMFDTYNSPRMEVMAVSEAQAIKVSRPPRTGASQTQIQTPTPTQTQRRQRQSNGAAAAARGDNDDGDEGSPVETQATQATDKGLKHSEVLVLLASLVAEGWLEKSRVGFYSLTPRALMELEPWLRATYNDDSGDEWQRIKSCEACKEIVTSGQRCTNLDCDVRMHDGCQAAYWRARRGREKKCPARDCQTVWDENHFVGERAVTSAAGYQRASGARRARASTGARRGQRRGGEEEEDGEGEEEDMEVEEEGEADGQEDGDGEEDGEGEEEMEEE